MATIKNIAEAARVSIKTVSRVINDDKNVSAATRERVEKAISDLNYVPNAIARSLVTNKTKTIGILLSQIDNPFFPRVIYGIEDTASSKGYNVLIIHSKDAQSAIRGITTFVSKQVDAVIIFPMDFPEGETSHFEQLKIFENHLKSQAAYYKNIGLPICFINPPFEYEFPEYSAVYCNEEICGKLAVDHLVSLGHKKIAHISGPVLAGMWKKRFDGYRSALTEHGLNMPEDYLRLTLENTEAGAAAARELLSLSHPPTAIYCANDTLAFGAINGVRQSGLSVPEDVSIVGTDGVNLSSISIPSITTVAHRRYFLGHQAVHSIINSIEQQEMGLSKIVIVPSLEVKGSSAEVNAQRV